MLDKFKVGQWYTYINNIGTTNFMHIVKYIPESEQRIAIYLINCFYHHSDDYTKYFINDRWTKAELLRQNEQTVPIKKATRKDFRLLLTIVFSYNVEISDKTIDY